MERTKPSPHPPFHYFGTYLRKTLKEDHPRLSDLIEEEKEKERRDNERKAAKEMEKKERAELSRGLIYVPSPPLLPPPSPWY